MSKNYPNRRSIRLRGYDYAQAGFYFVTICTRNREFVFGHIAGGKMILNHVGEIARDCWLEIPDHYPQTILHDFVIMPNHIHGIIQIDISLIQPSPPAVGAKYFSPDSLRANDDSLRANNDSPLRRPTGTSQTVGAIVRGFKTGVTKRTGYSVWQRNYHEHIIRDERSLHQISQYIVSNPARWQDDCFIAIKIYRIPKTNNSPPY